MKLLTAIISTLMLIGCSSDPFIVPDPTSDNVVMLELKDKIANPGPFQPTYGWLFWYGPLAILLLMWGYRHLIRKPITCIEEEPTANSVGKTTHTVEVDGKPGD